MEWRTMNSQRMAGCGHSTIARAEQQAAYQQHPVTAGKGNGSHGNRQQHQRRIEHDIAAAAASAMTGFTAAA